MQLPFTKCTKCGKSTLTDEYDLTGCSGCGDKSHGMDYGAYKRREQLAPLKGTHTFHGRFRKVGNLHYNNSKEFVLVENIKCGTDNLITGHTYITHVSPNTLKMLKQTPSGTHIQFKARVHQYNNGVKKFGLDHMYHCVQL